MHSNWRKCEQVFNSQQYARQSWIRHSWKGEGKISAQPYSTFCIQFLDRKNNDKNNTMILGKQICVGCAEILPRRVFTKLSWPVLVHSSLCLRLFWASLPSNLPLYRLWKISNVAATWGQINFNRESHCFNFGQAVWFWNQDILILIKSKKAHPFE